MNKSPLETGRQMEMTEGARQELIIWSSSPVSKTVYNLLESIVLDARDEAMAVDPAEEAKQKARTTEAHAMAKMYQIFRTRIENIESERLAEIKEKANRAIIAEDSFIEQVLMNQ